MKVTQTISEKQNNGCGDRISPDIGGKNLWGYWRNCVPMRVKVNFTKTFELSICANAVQASHFCLSLFVY
jgi:hypothetical protein